MLDPILKIFATRGRHTMCMCVNTQTHTHTHTEHPQWVPESRSTSDKRSKLTSQLLIQTSQFSKVKSLPILKSQKLARVTRKLLSRLDRVRDHPGPFTGLTCFNHFSFCCAVCPEYFSQICNWKLVRQIKNTSEEEKHITLDDTKMWHWMFSRCPLPLFDFFYYFSEQFVARTSEVQSNDFSLNHSVKICLYVGQFWTMQQNRKIPHSKRPVLFTGSTLHAAHVLLVPMQDVVRTCSPGRAGGQVPGIALFRDTASVTGQCFCAFWPSQSTFTENKPSNE